MLDILLDGLKGQVAGAIAEKAGIEVGQAEKAIPLAGDSIKEGIMGAVSNGNAGDILSMFSSLAGDKQGGIGGAASLLSGLTGGGSGAGGMMNNMVLKSIASNYIGKLTGQLGLPSGIVDTISGMALPMIMEKIKGASSNDKGEIDHAGLLGNLGLDAGSLLSGGSDALKDQAVDMLKDKLGNLGGGLGKLFG